MAPSIASRLGTVVAVLVALIFARAPGWSDDEWSHRYPPHPDEANGWFVFQGGRDGKTALVGRVFLPASDGDRGGKDSPPPVVVMAQGLGLTQDCSLGPFVSAFQDAGLAAVTFDYATFGASANGGGMPRHAVDPETHVSDLLSAVRAVRSRADDLVIDGDRMALWGTSLGGGHVVAAAAALSDKGGERDEGLSRSVKATVALVPHMASGFETMLSTVASDPATYVPGLAKVFSALVKGALLGLVGRPWYVPLHGPPGSVACMQNPGDDEGYASLCPNDGGAYGRRNGMTVGSMLRLLAYRPLNRASRIKVPVQMVAVERDTLCPARWARKAAEQMEKVEEMVIPGLKHFDVYKGEPLKAVLEAQVAFLKKNLQ